MNDAKYRELVDLIDGALQEAEAKLAKHGARIGEEYTYHEAKASAYTWVLGEIRRANCPTEGVEGP